MTEYVRNVKLDKQKDEFNLSESITFENGTKNKVVFNYISVIKPEIKGENLTFGDFAQMAISANKEYKAYVEDVKLNDEKLNAMWNGYVYRTCLEFNGIDKVNLKITVK